jgi:hypothetical protein
MSSKVWFTIAFGAAVSFAVAVASATMNPQYHMTLLSATFWVLAVIIVVFGIFKGFAALLVEQLKSLGGEFAKCRSVTLGWNRGRWLKETADPREWSLFELLCRRAVRLVKSSRRIKRSFPPEIWEQPDDVAVWIAILLHFGLRQKSREERFFPSMTARGDVFNDVARASALACERIAAIAN